MTAAAPVYREKTASKEDIHGHLRACNHEHQPPLERKVDLLEYAGKIFANAETFEAWSRLLVAAGHGAVLPTPKEALLTSIALGRESIVSNGDYERALNQWTKRRGRRRGAERKVSSK